MFSVIPEWLFVVSKAFSDVLGSKHGAGESESTVASFLQNAVVDIIQDKSVASRLPFTVPCFSCNTAVLLNARECKVHPPVNRVVQPCTELGKEGKNISID